MNAFTSFSRICPRTTTNKGEFCVCCPGCIVASPFHTRPLLKLMSTNTYFWREACNASASRPVWQQTQYINAANGVAVSAFSFLSSIHRLTPPIDHAVHFRRCSRRCFLFAGVQAAALEAERLGGGWGPDLEESTAVQRLDVRWKHCGGCVYSPSNA